MNLLLILLCFLPLAAQETVDHSGAQKTIPWKMRDLEPGQCTVGEVYWNTTTGALRKCAATNSWADAGGARGGGGMAPYLSSLIAGPDSTKTITGASHGFTTTALLVAVYDNASPRNAISVGRTVNASTYDVVITFASPQSNYYVVISGGVGPAGAPGATGPAGPAGTSGTGTGNVNPTGAIVANRIATFADTTGDVIKDGTQHSLEYPAYLGRTK